MQYTPNLQSLHRNLNKASAFIDGLRDEGDSLIASATLLGGTKWTKRARIVVPHAQASDDTASWAEDLHVLLRIVGARRHEDRGEDRSESGRSVASVPRGPPAAVARRPRFMRRAAACGPA